MKRLLPAAGAALLGVAHAASFAPWGNGGFALAVLAAWALLLARQVRRQDGWHRLAVTGFAFGLGWFLAGVGWLFVSMHTYGQMPAPLAGLALLLFAAYLALFPAATAVLAGRLSGPVPGARFMLAFAGALTVAEIARGHLFTGFPWLAAGYAQIGGPLAGFAPVLGVYGVGFATALAAGGIAVALAGRGPVRARAAGVALAVAALGAGLATIDWSVPHGKPLSVRLVQGNVPQQMKFEPQTVDRTMRLYRDLAIAAPAALTVLPETAWTMPWSSTPADVAEPLLAHVQDTGSAIAIGMPLIEPAAPRRAGASAAGSPAAARPAGLALSNSVLLFDRAALDGQRPPQRYDKRHLVPFGEFVPWGFRWFVDLMSIPLGDFARGAPDQAPFAVADQRIAFNICYEDVFGEELQAAIGRSDGATILANVSNIGWFGRSHALPQHLQIARMRSLESARPTIRATNTGMTAVIDHRGDVLAQLPGHEVGVLAASVQGRTGLTPYTRSGNGPTIAIALAALAAAALAGRGDRRGARR